MKKIIPLLLFLAGSAVAMKETDLEYELKLNQSRLNSGLQKAALESDYELAKGLLAQGAEVNPKKAVWYHGFVDALSLAAYAKKEEICNLLIEHGADVNKVNWNGKTPLMAAASHNGDDYDPKIPSRICTFLLDHGADVNAQSLSGKTALIIATHARDGKTYDLLVAHGALKRCEDIVNQARNAPKKELTSVQRAYLCSKLVDAGCSRNSFNMALLLAASAHTLNEQTTANALLNAILNNRIATCQLMLDHGVNPDVVYYGRTALMSAARDHKVDLCRLFIKHGSNLTLEVHRHEKNIALALHSISRRCGLRESEAEEIIKLLLEHGANPNAIIRVGEQSHEKSETPLISAATWNADNVIKILCQYGGDLGFKAVGTGSALTFAAQRSDKQEACKALIIHSRFPACTNEERTQAQKRTRLRLWLMQKTCTLRVPKDVKALILAQEENVWEDACCTPLRFFEHKYDALQFMPFENVQTLIGHKAFELEKAVSVVKAHKCAQLKRLMLSAAQGVVSTKITKILNPDLLEENFGKEIKDVIRTDCEETRTKKSAE